MTTAQLEELRQVPVEAIKENPYQPRREFQQGDLQELADSIRDIGILHPPTVRVLEDGSYELISGERRYRAAKLAGLKAVPVLVRETSDDLSAQAALVENLQRVDLNPIEVALALRGLVQDFDMSQEEVAKRVGKKRSTVANYLRLLSLPEKIQSSVAGGTISMGHAKVVLSISGADKQLRFFDAMVNGKWSVRQSEGRAKQTQAPKAERTPQNREALRRDMYLESIASKLQQRLGTKVSVAGSGKQGKICIDYYSLDDLDRVLDVMGVIF